MDKELAKRLADRMTVRSYGIDEIYTTSFNNLELDGGDGTVVQYQPPSNMRLQMTNIPATRRDGEPVLMSKDEIVLCRLGLDRNGLTRASRAALSEEDRAALEFYENLDVLEYQARLELAYGKCDVSTPEEALTRPELNYIGPDLERHITEGVMDVLFVDEANYHPGSLRAGRPQRASVDLYWLRRIIRKQKPGDKLDFGQYFLKLTGDVSQTLAGDSRFITHVIYGKMPSKSARKKPLDHKVGRLGLQGRGFLVVLRMQDIRHAIETYMSQLVAFPDGRGTMHNIWLLDHPTPGCMEDEGLGKFLAQIAAAIAPPAPAEADGAKSEAATESGQEPASAEPQTDADQSVDKPVGQEPSAQTDAEPASAEANPGSEADSPANDQGPATTAASAAPVDEIPPEVQALLTN